MLKTKTRKAVALSAACLLLMGAALAALLLRSPMTGGGNIQAATGVEFTSAAVTNTLGVVTCSAILSGNTVQLTMTNAQAGAACDVRFGMRATGADANLVVQDVKFSSATVEGFLTNGTGPGCEKPVTTAGMTVDARFRVPADATPTTFTAQADAGVFVTDSYNDASCPRAA
jgi:hypothetical protein